MNRTKLTPAVRERERKRLERKIDGILDEIRELEAEQEDLVEELRDLDAEDDVVEEELPEHAGRTYVEEERPICSAWFLGCARCKLELKAGDVVGLPKRFA